MKNIKLECGIEVEIDDVLINGWTDFWLAVDSDGELFAFTKEPHIAGDFYDSDEDLSDALGIVDLGDVDWKTTVQFVACIDDLVVKPVVHQEEITLKQADFFDELADLLAKHSASIASNSNLNIQIKGRTIPHKGKAGRWYGSELVEGKIISAKTIRKFRLRSKVV